MARAAGSDARDSFARPAAPRSQGRGRGRGRQEQRPRQRTSSLLLAAFFFELYERTQKILRVHESDALAMDVALGAFPENAPAGRGYCPGGLVDVLHAEAEMMDAAIRIALEEF